MSFMTAYRAMSPAAWSNNWTPDLLGASLLAWWDAQRSDLITQLGGAVSSWKDIVGGYDAVQALGASKPVYDSTGFNGSPAIYGDGLDDELTLAPVPAGIPVGAIACEEWWLVDQRSLVADTTARTIGGWGGSTTSVSRRMQRTVVAGVNRASVIDTGSTFTNASSDFSGRHVLRLIATGTQIDLEVDGVSAGGAAQVSAIGTSRLRFFANTAATAGGFALAGVAARAITLPLSAQDAASMYGFLNRRL